MISRLLPRYPIYIPSKGRADACLTARFLVRDKTPFRIVVEPQEAEAYAKNFGEENILVLPFSNLGLGSIPARNWIKDHSIKEGHLRHWQLDDNIRKIRRLYRGERIPCDSGPALAAAEDFTDRYENIGITGLEYMMFAVSTNRNLPPFRLNTRVYSCSLVLNRMPYRWRGRYNEDTDLCLQALAGGYCTVLILVFLVEKMPTMTMRGGNASQLYTGDGRLKMARALERMWPGVVTTHRRFQRPQHVVSDSWRKFSVPLIPKKNSIVDKKPNEYGLKLVSTK